MMNGQVRDLRLDIEDALHRSVCDHAHAEGVPSRQWRCVVGAAAVLAALSEPTLSQGATRKAAWLTELAQIIRDAASKAADTEAER